MRVVAIAVLVAACGTWGGCRIASPDVPEWIEAHGRGQVIALTADAEGAYAIGTNHRIYVYPGPFMQPWQERFGQDANLIAAGGGTVAWLGGDGAVRVASANLAPRELAGSRDWRVSALAVGPDSNVYVVSSARAWRVMSDTLGEAICEGEPAVGIAPAATPAGPTVHVWRGDGTVVARGSDGRCVPVSVPFPVVSLAASGAQLAAVDRDGGVWRRRAGTWQRLPVPQVFRPDRFPYQTVIRNVAMSETVLWGRSQDNLAFILSDPT